MSRVAVCFIVAFGLATTTGFAEKATGDADDIRLAGCLVRGEEGKGYLLTNVAGEPAWQRSADATIVPGPVGTSGAVATIFYWIDAETSLDQYVGQNVEVDGRLSGDLKEGQITLDRTRAEGILEIRSEGRSLKARVSRSVLVAPAGAERDGAVTDVLVREVEPTEVRMIAATCKP